LKEIYIKCERESGRRREKDRDRVKKGEKKRKEHIFIVCSKNGAATFSIMTFSIMTLSITIN
jgi:hypothetical protein